MESTEKIKNVKPKRQSRLLQITVMGGKSTKYRLVT